MVTLANEKEIEIAKEHEVLMTKVIALISKEGDISNGQEKN